MPEAPVHNRLDWPHHFAWVRRVGGATHAQAHDAAHGEYSIAYGRREGDALIKGAHSHYAPPLVCTECGHHVGQDFAQWRSRLLPCVRVPEPVADRRLRCGRAGKPWLKSAWAGLQAGGSSRPLRPTT